VIMIVIDFGYILNTPHIAFTPIGYKKKCVLFLHLLNNV
jgi:hypothetical protein